MYSHLPEALVTHVAGPVLVAGHVNSFSTTLFIELLLTHEKFGGSQMPAMCSQRTSEKAVPDVAACFMRRC